MLKIQYLAYHYLLVAMKAISLVHLECTAPTLVTFGILTFGFASKSYVCNNLPELLASLKPVKLFYHSCFIPGYTVLFSCVILSERENGQHI